MHFHFCRFNHCEIGKATLLDLIDAIGGMLVDLGHTVSRDDDSLMTAPAVNVVFEAFNRPIVRVLRDARRQGFRVVVVATESVNGWWALNGMIRSPEMRKRRRWLPGALKEAAAVWCLVPGQAVVLKRWCANAHDIELGLSESRLAALAGAQAQGKAEPEALFCFHGGLTRRRAAVINAFRHGGINVLVPETEYGPLDERNDIIARAMVSLALKPARNWRLVSNSRIQAALHCGRPVLAEDVDDGLASPWRGIVPFVKTPELPVWGIRMAARWREEWCEQIERYRELLPPSRAIGHAVAAL